MQLKQGVLLQGGKYRIEKVLGQGGFGITYLAKDTRFERLICIKEFFMKEYCNREQDKSHISVVSEGAREQVEKYRAKFVKEARLISSMNHPHIITIYDIFEENGSAYYTMEYLGGGSLKTIVEQNGILSEEQALKYISEIADALSYIHSGKVMHLDVKPSNIMLDSHGKAVLIDFGISKKYDHSGGQTSSTPVGISKGYAPMEQYNLGGVSTFSPETDIYSLGATLYYLLVGQPPKEATVINEEGLDEMPRKISRKVKQAIRHAMQPRRKNRTHSIELFIKELGITEGKNVKLSKGEDMAFGENLPIGFKLPHFSMNSVFAFSLWATYPLLWIIYNKMGNKPFKAWHLYANPTLWIIVYMVSNIQIADSYFFLRFIMFGIMWLIGTVTFTVLFKKESNRLALNKYNFFLHIILVFLTFSLSNIISYILYNIILPLILGVSYLKDRKKSTHIYSISFRWLSIINTSCASLLFLFIFYIVFILGFDS